MHHFVSASRAAILSRDPRRSTSPIPSRRNSFRGLAILVLHLAVVSWLPVLSWAPAAPAADRTAALQRGGILGTGERVAEREQMVRSQIAGGGMFREAVSDSAVLRAMRTVPRHAFVPDKQRAKAYADTPLPIGHGQTISQPFIVAVMTELLQLGPDSRVLEIGTGSGYQAAVLAQIADQVYSIEIIDPLAQRARDTLRDLGLEHVRLRRADGYHGWPEAAPFDAIIVTCASGHLPPPLWEQLKPGGRIVIPIGGTWSVQRLVVVEKTPEGRRRSNSVMAVRFVPMTGRAEQPPGDGGDDSEEPRR